MSGIQSTCPETRTARAPEIVSPLSRYVVAEAFLLFLSLGGWASRWSIASSLDVEVWTIWISLAKPLSTMSISSRL